MKTSRMLFFCSLIAGCVYSEVTISNLTVAQRPGTKLMDITYDVSSSTTNAVIVWVSLTVSNGAVAINAISLTGDVGWLATGTGKSVVWNAGADWNGNLAELNYVLKADDSPPPAGMVLIPGGTNEGTVPDPDGGAYSLTVEPFYMDATEVTKAQWDEVYNWAITRGYSFDNAGSGKAANYPVDTVNWYDCVKWCNARSEKEGRPPAYTVSGNVYRTGSFGFNGSYVVYCDCNANGYRLPIVTEHQYASRGGLVGKRFPWGDTVTHSQANYYSTEEHDYDISPTREYHPTYNDGTDICTSPVGAFAANGYGLYDMSGNVWEWCLDSLDVLRGFRGGNCSSDASDLRCGYVGYYPPSYAVIGVGFRAVCR